MSEEIDFSQYDFKLRDKINDYLKKMIAFGGSDLHVKAKSVVRARKDGKIHQFPGWIMSTDDSRTLAKEILKGDYMKFTKQKEYDTVHKFNEKYSFRVNFFFQKDGVSAVFRIIPTEIPPLKDLGMPSIVSSFANKERGLVLVTGVTGSGKSTTLASIIDLINRTKYKHIITIEDPIEFTHKDRLCIVNQRSVGKDTLSFKSALKAALREDPDIILVGEMRDRETVELALHAADTGHLVFSTLHTTDAKETVNRIISYFPVDEQQRVRLSLSNVIQGVISQRLIPTEDKDGKPTGRRAAMEIMVRTPTIEKLILENRDNEIPDVIEAGRDLYHSQTFDQSILDLYNEGVISKEKAKDYATSASDLELKMSGLSSGKVDTNQADKYKKEDLTQDDDIFDLK
ncbi:PilT/PilU family type 4a pilus ATPase [Sulfurimonas lithotrophica]|uniref:PilT/PilU family type 4a pilus ATPase n=1 Tax=Sulfurimonas lithotrophica TaxID=2590022 RepID=A0A5P8NZ27_9BACT|nr:PilT/PilU family type 4a pilus ATPase [Sulfurimonas lithotrophica]QFR48688.1 PilT/PilU family type 4a pilus ATPase [Sulfurimonas lithotrophica]